MIFLILGFLCLGLGTVGILLPILPTVPFYLATLFCFTQSSEKLRTWFVGTELYRKHLESFVKKKGMTKETKRGIVLSVTILMGIGMFLMASKSIWIPCVILAAVWVAHVVYFVFKVKTIASDTD